MRTTLEILQAAIAACPSPTRPDNLILRLAKAFDTDLAQARRAATELREQTARIEARFNVDGSRVEFDRGNILQMVAHLVASEARAIASAEAFDGRLSAEEDLYRAFHKIARDGTESVNCKL